MSNVIDISDFRKQVPDAAKMLVKAAIQAGINRSGDWAVASTQAELIETMMTGDGLSGPMFRAVYGDLTPFRIVAAFCFMGMETDEISDIACDAAEAPEPVINAVWPRGMKAIEKEMGALA